VMGFGMRMMMMRKAVIVVVVKFVVGTWLPNH
jgi:hypothetical protein